MDQGHVLVLQSLHVPHHVSLAVVDVEDGVCEVRARPLELRGQQGPLGVQRGLDTLRYLLQGLRTLKYPEQVLQIFLVNSLVQRYS